MKNKTILLLLLSTILSNYVYADDANYTISSDKKTITVTGDCTIPLAEFAPSNLPIYGDGEHGGVGHKDDREIDLFQSKTRKLNPSIKGIDFKRDEGKAIMRITFAELPDNQTLFFFHAKSDSLKKEDGSFLKIDWSPNQTKKFSISVLKMEAQHAVGVASSLTLDGTSLPSDVEHTLLLRTDSLAEKMSSLRSKIEQGIRFDWKTIVGIMCLLLLIFYVFYLYIKSCLKMMDEEIAKLKTEIQKLRLDISKISTTAKRKPNEPAPSSTLNEDIKKFIVSQIKTMQQTTVPVPTPPVPTPPAKKTDSENNVRNTARSIDTEVVKYNPSDNSFTLEESETHIFRIYSQNGKFFYTIVESSDIRSQLGAMLQAFEPLGSNPVSAK